MVDLAGLPPQVRLLQLTEVDRIVVPPPPPSAAPQEGASVAHRLLAAAQTAGEATQGCCW